VSGTVPQWRSAVGGQCLTLPELTSLRAARVGHGRCRLCLGYAPHPTPSRHRCRPARHTAAPPRRPRHRRHGTENRRNTMNPFCRGTCAIYFPWTDGESEKLRIIILFCVIIIDIKEWIGHSCLSLRNEHENILRYGGLNTKRWQY